VDYKNSLVMTIKRSGTQASEATAVLEEDLEPDDLADEEGK